MVAQEVQRGSVLQAGPEQDRLDSDRNRSQQRQLLVIIEKYFLVSVSIITHESMPNHSVFQQSRQMGRKRGFDPCSRNKAAQKSVYPITEPMADANPTENKISPGMSKEKGLQDPDEKERTKEKKVTFNFVDVDISVVVKFISEVTGKNFVYDDKVKGTITIIAPSRLSVDDAFSLFTSVLELKGFTVVPAGKVYKIIPVAQAKQSGTEMPGEGGLTVSDAYIIRLIPLTSISAAKPVGFLQPLISKDGHISSL